MKKIILLFLVISLFFSNAYTQEKNNISLNFESFEILPKIGVGFEREINNYISYIFGGNFYWTSIFVADASHGYDTKMGFDFLVHFRYYPMKTSIKKLFWDIGTGYKIIIYEKDDTNIYNLFPIQTRIGWKFSINNFSIQPWLGYNKDFGKGHYNEEVLRYGNPILGLSLGYLF